MACDITSCGGLCNPSSPGSSNMYLQNPYINPSLPNPGDNVSVYGTVYNGFPASTSALLCVYDSTTGSCLAMSELSGLLSFQSKTFGPLYIGIMPSHDWKIQVAAVQARIPGVWYQCGHSQEITIPCSSDICTTDASTCNLSTEIPFMTTCIPKEIIFLGAALVALFMITKK